MNKIESRPAPSRKWTYVFFIDVDGHQDNERLNAALKELHDQTSLFKILGSYPRATL